MKISFIGGGVMAEAIISGLLNKKIAEPKDITVSDVSSSRLKILQGKYQILPTSTNLKATQNSEIVVLAIKPVSLKKVATELKGNLLPEQLLLSIIAGIKIETLSEELKHICVVRVMPNTPAQIGKGISVWTATNAVTESQKEAAQLILSSLGKEIYVEDEKYIDMATAVSGSGPAYIFLVIEALIDAGVHIGIPREMAKEIVLETVEGSACLAKESGRHPADLKNMVTSPGGTTAEGLLELERNGIRAALIEAVIAAYEKSKFIGVR
jgi:pyrroline-5-carboxylate reductase